MTIKKRIFYLIAVLLSALIFAFALTGCEETKSNDSEVSSQRQIPHLQKDGSYTTRDDVMNYLIEYHTLPSNFITKKEAKKLGWRGGSLEPYAPGKCIGGDRYKNYEGLLPENDIYHECDIDTLGAKNRGQKRIIYSDSGSIYYTEDHYNTFECLYREDYE